MVREIAGDLLFIWLLLLVVLMVAVAVWLLARDVYRALRRMADGQYDDTDLPDAGDDFDLAA